jgi:prophage antirepressor-like protein
MTTLINTIDQNFNFNNDTIRVSGTYNEPWFVAKDICHILGLTNVTEALRNIPDKWRSSEILKCANGQNMNMIIINEPAIYRLIMRSNKPIALKFQEFVCEDILPIIRKEGEYNLKKQLIEKEKELSLKENELVLKKLELSWISKFNKKSVVYIGFIGIIDDKNYYKFGWTDDIQRRTIDHKNNYGRFDLQYVLECNQNIVLEQKLKDHKEIKKVRCSRVFKEKNRTELIVLNNEFTIENIKTILKKLKASIDENEYISAKHKEKLMELQLEIIKEQTKQKELILKYSCQTKDNESLLLNKKIEYKVQDKVEDNNQIEFIDEEIEFVLEDDDINDEDDDIDDEDDDTECCILRKCNICNIDKKLTKFSKCININTYRLTCKQCVNEKKETEKAKVKYTKIKGVKHFWSQEETEILLKAVLTYGTKWSKILKNNPILVENNRSQIDLKDKYRNVLKSKK